MFHGKEYHDGTEFADDKDPCGVCYCYGGDVVCTKTPCYGECSHPYKPPEQCCGECERMLSQHQTPCLKESFSHFVNQPLHQCFLESLNTTLFSCMLPQSMRNPKLSNVLLNLQWGQCLTAKLYQNICLQLIK